MLAILSLSLTGLASVSAGGLRQVDLASPSLSQDKPLQDNIRCDHAIVSLAADHFQSSIPSYRTSSHKTNHKEKRHGKTLVSQAIIIDFSAPSIPFFYCNKNFCAYFPGGCIRRYLSPLFLRGPPVW
ncbi:MAG: hypothetical protein Q8927_16515 [Bacteroidota bacterium]|nr:hypothetical protein [Bacteroidota bacterium]MDP4247135.1 hypothetical protein [Bacteroidota bacterium]MDP4252371.1 hypothetical protein [Bacteroidota bacterium]MDP4257928.1 hypothetical protein [Bacteroidota bacterium]